LNNGHLKRVATVQPASEIFVSSKLELIASLRIRSNLDGTGDVSIDARAVDFLVLLDSELELVELQGKVDLRGRPSLLIGLGELIIERRSEVVLTSVDGAGEVVSAPSADEPSVLGGIIGRRKVLDIEDKVAIKRRARQTTELERKGKLETSIPTKALGAVVGQLVDVPLGSSVSEAEFNALELDRSSDRSRLSLILPIFGPCVRQASLVDTNEPVH